MASSPSLEASEIRRRGRRRLLGAVTLVLLIVVFVPMILDSDPRPQRAEPALAIPPKENPPPLPTPAPAPSPSSRAPAPSPSSRAAETANGPGSNVAAPQPAPAKVEPAPAKAATPPPKPKLEGFAVQVGAFRDEARLQQARQKLETAHVVHYTERVETKGGTITRLRAGPFKTREAAEKTRATLKAASLDGKVVPLP